VSYDLELRPKGSKKLDVTAAERLAQNHPVLIKTGEMEYGPATAEITFELFVSEPDNFVGISIPYWEGLRINEIFKIIGDFARTLDLEIFDPQAEKVFGPDDLQIFMSSWGESLDISTNLFRKLEQEE